MLGMMRDNPGRYEVAIPGPGGTGNVAPVIAMMSLLWEGQTSRHGGQRPTRPETREEAEMAVQLAATLVLWFTNGMIRRKQRSHVGVGPGDSTLDLDPPRR